MGAFCCASRDLAGSTETAHVTRPRCVRHAGSAVEAFFRATNWSASAQFACRPIDLAAAPRNPSQRRRKRPPMFPGCQRVGSPSAMRRGFRREVSKFPRFSSWGDHPDWPSALPAWPRVWPSCGPPRPGPRPHGHHRPGWRRRSTAGRRRTGRTRRAAPRPRPRRSGRPSPAAPRNTSPRPRSPGAS